MNSNNANNLATLPQHATAISPPRTAIAHCVKKNILLFYLNTGGGHLAPARSIAKFLEHEFPNRVHPELIDGLVPAPAALRSILEDVYRMLQLRGRRLYALVYFMNKFRPLADLNRTIVSRFVLPYLEEKILSEHPERIVVLHFLLIKPVT